MTIVTVLSCLERGLGFLYRIFLSRNIGSEGLGLYQIALSVVGVMMTVSASGIPITVSRMMIKDRAAKRDDMVNSTVTAGIVCALGICLPICIFCFIFKDVLTLIFPDERCRLLFLIIMPGVVLTSVYAVIRGFFWGTKSFSAYSVIELSEEFVMVAVGMFFVSRARSVTEKTVWASIAVLVSYIFSFTLSSIVFAVKGGRLKNPSARLKPLIASGAPITFMRGATSLTSSLIAVILPSALIASGLSRQQAVSSFGIISGMTLPLLFIPSTIIGSVSLVLVPELSNDFYRKNDAGLRANVEKALMICATVAMLIIPVFIGAGPYIGELVYNNRTAGVYLRAAAIAMLPMSLAMISTSLLNSMGMEKKTLLYYLIGAGLLLVCVAVLPRFIGNYGLISGYLLNFTVNGIFNVRLLKKICCDKLSYIKKQLIALPIVGFCSLLCYFLFEIIAKTISPFFALLICVILIPVCLLTLFEIFNIIRVKELIGAFLPQSKIETRLKKAKRVKRFKDKKIRDSVRGNNSRSRGIIRNKSAVRDT